MPKINRCFRSMLFTSVITLAGCAIHSTKQIESNIIFHGGPILTMNGDQPTYVEAVIVKEGKIVFAGNDTEAMKQKNSKTIIRNLEGATLLPGFIDPHSHFIDSLALADRVNVSAPPVGPASNPEQIVETLKKAAAAKNLKPGEPLLGWGYDENLMPKGKPLSRDILDRAFPNNPIGIIHVSMHGAVINSKAMELYGYKDGMPTPPGGIILRKPGTQKLQGLVMETGYFLMHTKLPLPDMNHEMEAARTGQLIYAAAGITTVQEGATMLPTLQLLQRVAAKDGLIIDVIAYPFVTDLEAIVKENPVSTFGQYRNKLKIGGCKVTIDGSPQGKTAWFTTPYLTGGPNGEKTWKGSSSLPLNSISNMVKFCYDNNLQMLMHGNGDAAIDFLIKTHKKMIANDLEKDRRTVCIHCQFIRPDQINEFTKYKIIPSLFTDHTFFFGDTHIANRGLTQASFISPMKAAINAGLRPTNHTDAFVVPIDQMMTIWTAVNRPLRSGGVLGADQRITPYQALQAITVNSAYQYREEATKGSITPGKRADLVILSADPTKVAPNTIKDIKVLETIKDGKTIYKQTANL